MMRRATSVFTLCMVTFIQAYLLVSIFPYGAYMAVLLWNNNASSSSTLQQNSDMDSRRQQLFQTINASGEDTQHEQTTIRRRRLLLRERIKSKIPRTITVEDAGPYAALLATSFMIGRTVAALFWGHLADIYGRRVVLLVSLIGSGFATLWFGMTTRYGGLGGAVMARGFVGAWNSIVGVSKTLATELAFHDFGDKDLTMHEGGSNDKENVEHTLLTQQGSKESETSATSNSSPDRDDQSSIEQQQQLETRIVGLTMSMRAWGFLVAPALAGFIADPLNVRTHDHTSEDITNEGVAHRVSHRLLETYPYLLPNLLGAILCWLSALAVYFCLPETLPECSSISSMGKDFCNWVSGCIFTVRDKINPVIGVKDEAEAHRSISAVSYGSLEGNISSVADEEQQCQVVGKQSLHKAVSSVLSRPNTRYHLLAYWYYSLVIIAIDEAFPLFCISRHKIKHGLSEAEIGGILSFSGLIFSLTQYPVYTTIISRFGIYASLGSGVWLGVFPVVLIPLASIFADIESHASMFYLALLLGITKIFQSVFFSSVTILTNRTVPIDLRSIMNGVGGMGAGISKAIGPIIAGFWVAYCLSSKDSDLGSLVAFGGIACLGLVLLAMLPLLQGDDD